MSTTYPLRTVLHDEIWRLWPIKPRSQILAADAVRSIQGLQNTMDYLVLKTSVGNSQRGCGNGMEEVVQRLGGPAVPMQTSHQRQGLVFNYN